MCNTILWNIPTKFISCAALKSCLLHHRQSATIRLRLNIRYSFTCMSTYASLVFYQSQMTTAQSNERRAFVVDKLSATMEMSFAFIFPIIVRWHQVESSSPKSELLLHRFSMSFQLIPKNIIGYRSASKVAIVSDLLRFLFLISISSHTM